MTKNSTGIFTILKFRSILDTKNNHLFLEKDEEDQQNNFGLFSYVQSNPWLSLSWRFCQYQHIYQSHSSSLCRKRLFVFSYYFIYLKYWYIVSVIPPFWCKTGHFFSDCFYLFKISQNLDHLTCTYVISPNFLRKCKTSGSWIYSSN